MNPATIKGATHNPGAPRGWTEANGPCGTLPIIYRRDQHGNPESVSAWRPTPEELAELNNGGFVILSVTGWQVPVMLYTADHDAATDGRPAAPEKKHAHGEAFKLMWYACENCHYRERIWNSRDGVTPFCISCPKCAAMMMHKHWASDFYAPDHKVGPGERFFRDGTPDEAEAIMRKRIESMRAKYPCTPEKEAELIAAVRSGDEDGGEFRKGWPMLDDNAGRPVPPHGSGPDATTPVSER